jgi:hypothetical protein
MSVKERIKQAATKKVVGTLLGAVILTITGVALPEPAVDAITLVLMGLFA